MDRFCHSRLLFKGNRQEISCFDGRFDRIGTLKGVTLTDLNAFVSLRTLAEKVFIKDRIKFAVEYNGRFRIRRC